MDVDTHDVAGRDEVREAGHGRPGQEFGIALHSADLDARGHFGLDALNERGHTAGHAVSAGQVLVTDEDVRDAGAAVGSLDSGRELGLVVRVGVRHAERHVQAGVRDDGAHVAGA